MPVCRSPRVASDSLLQAEHLRRPGWRLSMSTEQRIAAGQCRPGAVVPGRILLVLGTIFAGLFYFATAVFLVGVGARVARYARTPAPLVIPTTPCTLTHAGVFARMFREVVFFESLFKGSKWSWLFGWLFHFGMLIVLAQHFLDISPSPSGRGW